jgi:hypothetical protein
MSHGVLGGTMEDWSGTMETRSQEPWKLFGTMETSREPGRLLRDQETGQGPRDRPGTKETCQGPWKLEKRHGNLSGGQCRTTRKLDKLSATMKNFQAPCKTIKRYE